jgi:hypothetical protein
MLPICTDTARVFSEHVPATEYAAWLAKVIAAGAAIVTVGLVASLVVVALAEALLPTASVWPAVTDTEPSASDVTFTGPLFHAPLVQVGVAVMPPIDTVTARPFSEHVPATAYADWLATVIVAGALIATVGFTLSLVAVVLAEALLPTASVWLAVIVTEPCASTVTFTAPLFHAPLVQVGVAVMPPIDTDTARPFSEHVPATAYAAWLATVIAAGAVIVTVGLVASLVAVVLAEPELPAASVCPAVIDTAPSARAVTFTAPVFHASVVQVGVAVMPPMETVTARPFSEHVPATAYAAWLAEVIVAGALIATVGFTVSLVVVPVVVVELPSASACVTDTDTAPLVSAASVVGAAV